MSKQELLPFSVTNDYKSRLIGTCPDRKKVVTAHGGKRVEGGARKLGKSRVGPRVSRGSRSPRSRPTRRLRTDWDASGNWDRLSCRRRTQETRGVDSSVYLPSRRSWESRRWEPSSVSSPAHGPFWVDSSVHLRLLTFGP